MSTRYAIQPLKNEPDMLDFTLLQTHIYAKVRDEGGSLMPICERIELCVQNECIAVFEGRWVDFHYYVPGASFHIYKGRKLFKTAEGQFNYSRHLPASGEGPDRIELGTYDFCKLLKCLYRASSQPMDQWKRVSLTKELSWWLDQSVPFDPYLLAFFVADQADRIVYATSNAEPYV